MKIYSAESIAGIYQDRINYDMTFGIGTDRGGTGWWSVPRQQPHLNSLRAAQTTNPFQPSWNPKVDLCFIRFGGEKSSGLMEQTFMGLPIERKPSPEFNGMIEKFWFSGKGLPGRQSFEILPDGNFDLVFILNDSCCMMLFAGPYTRPTTVPILSGKDYFGVRFRPGRMPRLIDIQPAELVDTMIELPEVIGMSADSIGECLLNFDGIDAKRAFMEGVFRKIGIESIVRRDLCNRCAELVESCNGGIKIHDLAHRVGTHIRTLERTFLKNMGISPKMFVRLVRFQKALDKIKTGGYPTLTHIVHECGYSDQSHFIKEFQSLTGKLPSSA